MLTITVQTSRFLLCTLFCVMMMDFIIDIHRLIPMQLEGGEPLPINCADFALDPITMDARARVLAPEQARAKAYFHEQQMKRQMVSKDTSAKHFFQRNWEPSYSCTVVARMGCPGDGGKWVCDPHYYLLLDNCVVYSVGSNNEFSFEEAIHRFNPKCEIHKFDPLSSSSLDENKKPEFVHFHPWKLGSHDSAVKSTFTIQTIMRYLGHTNITVLKADCEGCELEGSSFSIPTFPPGKGAIQQILVEVHFDNGGPERVHDLFTFLSSKGYAIFSKEANIQYASDGKAVEFSLVHLDTDLGQQSSSYH